MRLGWGPSKVDAVNRHNLLEALRISSIDALGKHSRSGTSATGGEIDARHCACNASASLARRSSGRLENTPGDRSTMLGFQIC
eukprot:5585716-Pyramimonas_sp.AAC.1